MYIHTYIYTYMYVYIYIYILKGAVETEGVADSAMASIASAKSCASGSQRRAR